ncbi:hypothetical protein SAMN05428988_6557 [Chitinophaga sp. YR573]|uniref:hypothetical protein n=1 Tax=Chitinophaga sp. YR573 TaxID=1881040 RepID=UPI0008CF965D|nr:hypothetical protein [Chitinophaga sp. YR573]SEW46847.1 hypothetical protein SAMN05428988_6557 [Chitinophaga sp. YR573]
MESKNLVFKNGHFYDRETKSRIELKDGAVFCIVATTSDFISPLPAGTPFVEELDSKKKEAQVKKDSDLGKYKKVYNKGDFLYFSIQRQVDEKKIIHEFEVELQEDLYFHFKTKWKVPEDKLFDCACIVRRNISNTIEFFEEIHGGSLNEVYKSTFVHFFGNEGNPACNAMDRFYDAPGSDEKDSISRKRDTYAVM